MLARKRLVSSQVVDALPASLSSSRVCSFLPTTRLKVREYLLLDITSLSDRFPSKIRLFQDPEPLTSLRVPTYPRSPSTLKSLPASCVSNRPSSLDIVTWTERYSFSNLLREHLISPGWWTFVTLRPSRCVLDTITSGLPILADDNLWATNTRRRIRMHISTRESIPYARCAEGASLNSSQIPEVSFDNTSVYNSWPQDSERRSFQ
jgi:hypothetical protein